MNLRVNVGTENGYSYAILDGTPFAADANTVDEAIGDLIVALREYVEEWDSLKDAPNHAANAGLVELVVSRSDAELQQLFDVRC